MLPLLLKTLTRLELVEMLRPEQQLQEATERFADLAELQQLPLVQTTCLLGRVRLQAMAEAMQDLAVLSQDLVAVR